MIVFLLNAEKAGPPRNVLIALAMNAVVGILSKTNLCNISKIVFG